MVADSEYDEERLMRNTVPSAACLLILTLISSVITVPVHAEDTDEITRSAVLEEALRFSPQYTSPILAANGVPVAVYDDLNGNGRLDVAMLTIVGDPRLEAIADRLSNPLRIYDTDAVAPTYILETYFDGQEAIVTVELGRHEVWSGIGLRRLTPEPYPLAIEISFRSRAGLRTDLVIYHAGGSISRFSVVESRNQRGIIADIDGDGALDIVTAQRAPEAGRGYETFLELYKLRPQGYRRTASLPLVRATNDFLTAAAGEMTSGSWDTLWHRLGPTSSTTPEMDRVATDLARAFAGVLDEETDGSRFDYPVSDASVERVTFPRLVDNPFPAPFLGRSFRLVFRVECCDEAPRFFEAVVGLAANPFSGRPLAFLTEHEAGR